MRHNGLFAYHYAANPVETGELVRTRDHMAARGSNGKGAWFSQDVREASVSAASPSSISLDVIGREGCADAALLERRAIMPMRDVINMVERVTRLGIPFIIGQRWPGDPLNLVSDASKAGKNLGIVTTAWAWHQGNVLK